MTVKWYKPSKVHTGWTKDSPIKERRRKVLKAHKGDELASARSMQALANVTKDRPTRIQAKKDAKFFYREHAGN